LLSAFSATPALAVSGDNFEYHGYMRAGMGSSVNGGDQVCYHQANIPGNEFRLGNECGIYGENYLQAYTNRSKDPNAEFFRANFDFSYNPAGKNLGEPPNFNVFGAFVEAAHLGGGEHSFWIGKRYYRTTDAHMDDFFYFADTSGNGGGVEGIPLFNGKFAIALLQEDAPASDYNVINGNTVYVNGQPSQVSIQNGERPRTMLIDLRLLEMKIADHNQLNFWAGYAFSNGGTDGVTGQVFNSNSGFVGGVKYQYQTPSGYNRLSAIYGYGLMQGMNLSGTPFGADPTELQGQGFTSSAHRVRLVEEFVIQPVSYFATAFAAFCETWNSGAASFDNGHWYSVGARPIYFFSDHYSIMAEIGASNVKQTGLTGTQAGTPLVRATIAPQITPKSEFFARPSLRAFLTDTFGHDSAYGLQGEVWF
jgi:maltoporin